MYEDIFCQQIVELMELELSVPVPSKLELVPDFGTFSSVTQHHWLLVSLLLGMKVRESASFCMVSTGFVTFKLGSYFWPSYW